MTMKIIIFYKNKFMKKSFVILKMFLVKTMLSIIRFK